jgi:hypothetical protein
MKAYSLYLINELENKIELLSQQKDSYSQKDYELLLCRYSGQRDILYMIITGHNNGLIQEMIKEKSNGKLYNRR